MAPSKDDPPEPPRARWYVAPVFWLLAGCGVTLAVVVVLRLTQREAAATSPPARGSSSEARALAPEGSSALDTAGEQFASLYLAYLLKSYYVDSRGFCSKLLNALCSALVTTDLIANETSCQDLPNTELVLAIGRYQHHVGLPVDGKAGPETVRMILGGDFGSRREMASTYCPGSPLGAATPSATSRASASATP